MDCIKDKETKEYFNYIKKKHSVIKINYPESIDGEVIIKSIRKYPISRINSSLFRYEVDIDFKGCIWGRSSYRPKMQKHQQSDISSLSKVKIYRAMRTKVFADLKSRLSLFDVQLNRLENISKIKWVG